jgi:hypothetical protein
MPQEIDDDAILQIMPRGFSLKHSISTRVVGSAFNFDRASKRLALYSSREVTRLIRSSIFDSYTIAKEELLAS